jgi:clan AA aspartic protease
MDFVNADIILANPVNRQLKSMTVTALVDSSALHLCIPKHVAIQLELKELEKREVTLADGSKQLYPYVGPIEVSFNGRHCLWEQWY